MHFNYPMHFNYYDLACDCWFLLAMVWLFGLLTTKPDARTQSPGSRLLEMGLSLLAFCLVFTQYFRSGWRAWSFIPSSDISGALGLLLVLLGVAFAIWARLQLGGNWSGAVTVKEGHTLVCRGPYTIVRHPIYSGFLLALLGVALIIGEGAAFWVWESCFYLSGSSPGWRNDLCWSSSAPAIGNTNSESKP